MRKLLYRVFTRFARSLGILEIQSRLDEINVRLDSATVRIDSATVSIDRANALLPSPSREGDGVALRSDIGALELHLERRMDLVARETDLRHETMRALLDEAQQNVMSAAMRHSETLVGEMRSYVEAEIAELRRIIDHVRRVESTHIITSTSPTDNREAPMIDDVLYVTLEDKFRGDKETVANRQLGYLEFVRDHASFSHPVLDLGCGRGEWLSILREHGVPARGIDGNAVCIAECNEAGLNVELGDLVSTLSTMPDASYGAITMFQVLEHLPFNTIVQVLREARRVLVKGGCFIGEVPNAETLRVSSGTFWIDPTHIRPLYPAVLMFLAREVGFVSIDARYSSPIRPDPDFSTMPPELRDTFEDWHRAINGPGDFALIARA